MPTQPPFRKAGGDGGNHGRHQYERPTIVLFGNDPPIHALLGRLLAGLIDHLVEERVLRSEERKEVQVAPVFGFNTEQL